MSITTVAQFSHSIVSDSLWRHGLQHARLPCPSPTPGVYSVSCPSSRLWTYHLILCCPLFLLPSIFSSIRVFSNESVFHIRWPKHWSFSFSTSPDIINLLWILQMPASILEISKRFFYYLFVKFLSIQGFAPKIGTFIKYQRKDNFKPQEIFL